MRNSPTFAMRRMSGRFTETAPGVFSNVVELASESAVDQAWEDYCGEARRLVESPSLLCDRQFSEKLTRLHERWKRLFLIQEAGR